MPFYRGNRVGHSPLYIIMNFCSGRNRAISISTIHGFPVVSILILAFKLAINMI